MTPCSDVEFVIHAQTSLLNITLLCSVLLFFFNFSQSQSPEENARMPSKAKWEVNPKDPQRRLFTGNYSPASEEILDLESVKSLVSFLHDARQEAEIRGADSERNRQRAGHAGVCGVHRPFCNY